MLNLYSLERFLSCYLKVMNSETGAELSFPQRNSASWSLGKPTSMLSPNSHIMSKIVKDYPSVGENQTWGSGSSLLDQSACFTGALSETLCFWYRQTCPFTLDRDAQGFSLLGMRTGVRAKGTACAPSAGNRWGYNLSEQWELGKGYNSFL